MHIKKHKYDRYIVLEISGSLSVENISNFESILNYSEKEKKNIIFDLKNLEFIDSASMGIILLYHNKLKKNGLVLFLCGLNEYIRHIFRFSKIDHHIPAADTVKEAVKIINKPDNK